MFEAGDEVVVADAGPVRIGLSVCYDLRFPELYRALVDDGATLIVVPPAFTARTGQAHWEVLLRARAIEDQCFVVAAGQTGSSGPGLDWHGASMIIDPWGDVLARAPDAAEQAVETAITASCDLERVATVRGVLPSVANRRLAP